MIKKLLLSFISSLLLIPVFSVQASSEISPEELKAMYNTNVRRVISDAEFFGSFKEGIWVHEPMLKYDHDPKLKVVKAAAQSADYETASIELLAYFQNKFERPPIKPKPQKPLRVAMWQDLIFGFDQQLSVIDEFAIDQDAKEHVIDIENTKIFANGLTTLMFMGRHKNGMLSYIASRDSQTPPVLELILNDGTTVKLEAVGDTHIRAGKFSDQNYGNAINLEVCNSGLEIGKAYDDNTRRAFLAFDLTKTDFKTIKRARLKIHSWSIEDQQKMLLFHVRPTALNEQKMTWDNNIGYIYSWEGLPGGVDWDRPERAHGQFPNWTQRLYWGTKMAQWASRSNDREEERMTLDLFNDFITDYTSFADVLNYWMRDEMNAAGRIDYGYQLPTLLSLKACTPRDCVELLKSYTRDCDTLYINASRLTRGNTGNMGMTLMSSLIIGAVAFPELANSEAWLNDALDRLSANLKNMVLSDGAYVEHTFGYPFGVLTQMVDMLELLQEHDINPPEVLAKKTHQLARYLMLCAFPDGYNVKWGEGPGKHTKTTQPIIRAARYFKDPEMLWWVNNGYIGHAPKVTDVSYPEARIAVLRSSWEPEANVLFFAPRVGGGHYHVDQNSLALYAHGQKLLNDTGMSSYASQHPHFDWQRHQTRSHNTVEIDEKGYPRFDKTINPEEEGPCYSNVYTSSKATLADGWAEGYPDIRHARKIFFHKQAGIYIVADLMTPEDEMSHTYDQCWHIYPLHTYESDPETCKVWTTNTDGPNIEILPVYPQKLELLLRKGFNAHPLTDTMYPSFRQKLSGNAEFITILAPRPAQTKAMDLRPKNLDSSEGSRAIEIITNEGRGIFITSATQAPVVVKNIKTDASTAFVQFDKNDEVLWAVRNGGNMLEVNGRTIESEVMSLLSYPALPEPDPSYVSRVLEYQSALDAGREALKLREFMNATEKFKEASTLAMNDGDKAQALYNLALSWRGAGDHTKAIVYFDELLSLKYPPSNLYALSLRLVGFSHLELKHYPEAKNAFSKFLSAPGAPPQFVDDVEKALKQLPL